MSFDLKYLYKSLIVLKYVLHVFFLSTFASKISLNFSEVIQSSSGSSGFSSGSGSSS
jgi:hypothetical protein